MELLGEVAAIARYPVKSLAGEELQTAELAADGIPGDRAAALFVREGDVRAGKTYRGKEHNLLHTTRDTARALEMAREKHVVAEIEHGTHYFDVAPISLVFDRWVDEVSAALGRALDFRRWRPNLFARAAGGFAYDETALPGRAIEAGTCVLRVRSPIIRCAVPSYDVETGEPDPAVLRYLVGKRGNRFGVYCDVELAGVVRTGDALRLRAR